MARTHRLSVPVVGVLAVAAALCGQPPASAAATLSPLFRVDSDAAGRPLRDALSGAERLSGTGRYVAYTTDGAAVPGDSNGSDDAYRYDTLTGDVVRVSAPVPGRASTGGYSATGSISASGRSVAFESTASNLVPGAAAGQGHVYVRDLDRGSTTQVDLTPAGRPADGFASRPEISADGNHVVFCSSARDLLPGGQSGLGAVFIRDLRTGVTSEVDLTPSGEPQQGQDCAYSVSADGSKVVFASRAVNLPYGERPPGRFRFPMYLRDLTAGTTTYVGDDSAGSTAAPFTLSADGRTLAYTPPAVASPGGAACHPRVEDLVTGKIDIVDRAASGRAGNGCSVVGSASLSADGNRVLFSSAASNLVPGDTNGTTDTFVRDLRTGEVTRTSVRTGGRQLRDERLGLGAISGDGRVTTFSSLLPLLPGDTAGDRHLYGRTLSP